MKKRYLIAAGAVLGLCGLGFGVYHRNFRMPLKEYTGYALYMAVLDDEIARRELDEIELDDRTVEFPPKQESLQYRYHLFLGLNKGETKQQLQSEIRDLELRLRELNLGSGR